MKKMIYGAVRPPVGAQEIKPDSSLFCVVWSQENLNSWQHVTFFLAVFGFSAFVGNSWK